MMRSFFPRKSFFLLLTYLGVASCGSSDDLAGIFEISVTPTQSALVPTARRSCVDIYNNPLEISVAEASVGFSSFKILWKDPDRDLFVIKIQLDLEASLVATKIDITDPDEIGNMFGIGSGNDVKIPRFGGTGASPTGEYRTDLKDFDGNGEMDTTPIAHLACPLAFGGVSLPEDTETTIGGFIRILAIAQDDASNQEVLRLAIPVKLIISTD